MSEGPHQFLFCYFCSTVFVPLFFLLTFLHLHLGSPRSPPIFVPLFLFCSFCSTDLFALALRVPITQCLRIPTNFYSAVFVLLTFLHLHLGSPRVTTNFYSADLFALALRVPKGPQQFLCHCFCSAVFVPLTFLHLHLGGSMSEGLHQILFHCFYSAVFVLLFLFCWPFCTCTWSPQESPPIFVLLTFLHLHLGSPRVTTNFCTTVFVQQFLFNWPFCTCT